MTVRLAYRKPPLVLGLLIAFVLALLAFAAGPGAPSAAASACHQWGNSTPTELRAGQARKAILCLVNNERQQAGLHALDRDRRLQKAAQRHTDHMDGTGCFDHECGGESDLDQRLEGVGYLFNGLTQWAYGENIAWGMRDLGTPRAIVEAWMHSAPHRANILSGSFKEIGVGFRAGAPTGGGEPGGIYTTDFGLRVG